ncbi:hypothetical protein OZD70_04325 [Wolbachia endosymbiont of Drosophila tsacasi]|nr:hypothetical protein [Wolbachia endosymbiont of Drosophila tsacasi]
MKITEYLQHHDKGAGGVCQGSFLTYLTNFILAKIALFEYL